MSTITSTSLFTNTANSSMYSLFAPNDDHGELRATHEATMSSAVRLGELYFDPKDHNLTDFSMLEIWVRKPWADITLRLLVILPILLLGVFGNSAIIYSVIRYKVIRSKPTNIFLLNMAIADLFSTVICANAGLINNIHQFYVLGANLCRFEGFIQITFLLVSILSLIVLSYDRLISIIKPFWSRFGVRQAVVANIIIWIVSMLMASPLTMWRRLHKRQWRDYEEVWCYEEVQLYSKYYWLAITAFLIYLPMATMTIVFSIILAQMDKFDAKLRRSSVSTLHNPTGPTIKIGYRRKIIKVLLCYLLTTIICWTPLQITVFYRHFRKEPQMAQWFKEIKFVSQTFASLSSAINPIIFGILSEPFRKALYTSRLYKFVLKFNGVVKRPNRQQQQKQQQSPQLGQRLQMIQLDVQKLHDNDTPASPHTTRRSLGRTSPGGQTKRQAIPGPNRVNLNSREQRNMSSHVSIIHTKEVKKSCSGVSNRDDCLSARTISRRGLGNLTSDNIDQGRNGSGEIKTTCISTRRRHTKAVKEDSDSPKDLFDECAREIHGQKMDCINESSPSVSSPGMVSVGFTSINIEGMD